LLSMNINQPRIMTGLLAGYCHFTGHWFKLGLLNIPESDRSKQASETASHVLCDCYTLATLRYWHLGWHFTEQMTEDISVSRILHFVLRYGAAWCTNTGAEQRIKYGQSACVTMCPPSVYSILF
jgi:hypothetical protein